MNADARSGVIGARHRAVGPGGEAVRRWWNNTCNADSQTVITVSLHFSNSISTRALLLYYCSRNISYCLSIYYQGFPKYKDSLEGDIDFGSNFVFKRSEQMAPTTRAMYRSASKGALLESAPAGMDEAGWKEPAPLLVRPVLDGVWVKARSLRLSCNGLPKLL